MSSTSRRLAVTGLLCAIGTAAAVTAQAADVGSPVVGAVSAGAVAAPVPLVTSPNVKLLTTVPETGAISIEFARSTDNAYVSSLDTITVLDTTDPRAPRVKGTLVNALFENEAMTYGEKRGPKGALTQFVLAGIDLYQASPDDPSHVNVGGGEVAIVDVTDPTKPTIRSYVKAPTSTHTVQCVSQDSCDYAYTAGDDGTFSILDLRDLDRPAVLPVSPRSVASGPGGPDSPFGSGTGAGHYWEFEQDAPKADGSPGRRLGTHTGAGGAQVFDVSDPTRPVAIAATNARARTAPYNDFIFHNSMRPNARKFVEGAPPSIANGNVLLVTEEDYVNDGDEVACDKAGSFQTWYVPTLDAAKYQADSAGGTLPDRGTIEPLDITNAPDEFGGGLTTPVGAFCSAHWFDVHPSGFVAQGYYQQGLRIMDVRDARNIKQHGYATSAATQTWDAYFVPARNRQDRVNGGKTNIVYTADATRGVDVYEVDLPQ